MGTGHISPKVRRPGNETEHSQVEEYVELHRHTLMRLYGVLLNQAPRTLPYRNTVSSPVKSPTFELDKRSFDYLPKSSKYRRLMREHRNII